jgi:peptide/nickel transport system substrate-binding protein
VEKLSDYSVKFTTKDISGPFINNLTLALMPQSVWGKVDAQGFLLSQRNLEPIGTGPYVIKEKEVLPSGKVQAVTLEAFTDYFGGRPKIDNVKIRFYDTEADLLNALHGKEISAFGYAPLGSSLYLEKDQDNLQFLNLPLPQYQVVFFNLGNKILAEQGVRQALQAATDRQKIISDVFKDNAVLPVSPFDRTKTPLAAGSDLEKAKKLLDDAGWKVDSKTGLRSKKNASLELTIATNDSLLNSEAAEALANKWKALDIKVNLAILPTKQLTDEHIRTRNFDVLLFPLKFGADPDPFPFWHSSQVKDPGYNLTGFSDQNADKLITEARTTTDQGLRQEKYKEFDRLI